MVKLVDKCEDVLNLDKKFNVHKTNEIKENFLPFFVFNTKEVGKIILERRIYSLSASKQLGLLTTDKVNISIVGDTYSNRIIAVHISSKE
jgi:hypothetical protein